MHVAVVDPVDQVAAHTRWRHRASAPGEVQYVTALHQLPGGHVSVAYNICGNYCPGCLETPCPDWIGVGAAHVAYFLHSRVPLDRGVVIKPPVTTS